MVDGGKGRSNAGIVGDLKGIIQWHVEVGTNDDPLVVKVNPVESLLVQVHKHSFARSPARVRWAGTLGAGERTRCRWDQDLLAINLTRSRTRQEYAHSLSYHAMAFTIRCCSTVVKGASTVAECVSPFQSDETIGASEYWRIPL